MIRHENNTNTIIIYYADDHGLWHWIGKLNWNLVTNICTLPLNKRERPKWKWSRCNSSAESGDWMECECEGEGKTLTYRTENNDHNKNNDNEKWNWRWIQWPYPLVDVALHGNDIFEWGGNSNSSSGGGKSANDSNQKHSPVTSFIHNNFFFLSLAHFFTLLSHINKSALRPLRMHNVQLFKYNYHSRKVQFFLSLRSFRSNIL